MKDVGSDSPKCDETGTLRVEFMIALVESSLVVMYQILRSGRSFCPIKLLLIIYSKEAV